MTDVATEPPRPPDPNPDSLGAGVALGFGIHLPGQPIVLLLVWLFGALSSQASDPYFSILFLVCLANFGITQWIYVLPTWFVLRRKGRRETAKGLLITAACFLAINGVCTLAMVAGG